MSPKRRIPLNETSLSEGGLTHNPFAALRPDGKPAASPELPQSPQSPGSTGPGDAPAARMVVRREKKGRAGKTVTRVSGLDVEGNPLAELAREMKRALGCGATIEDGDVLLQGALTERAAGWLEKRFGAAVRIGN